MLSIPLLQSHVFDRNMDDSSLPVATGQATVDANSEPLVVDDKMQQVEGKYHALKFEYETVSRSLVVNQTCCSKARLCAG